MSNQNDTNLIIDKLELYNQAIDKTVSDFGAEVIAVKTDVAVINNKLDIFISELRETKKNCDDNTSWINKTIGWTTASGVFIFMIIGLVTYIFNSRVSTVDAQITEIKSQSVEQINKLIEVLQSKKNSLNTIDLKDFIAKP
jgi:hypothetical protein